MGQQSDQTASFYANQMIIFETEDERPPVPLRILVSVGTTIFGMLAVGVFVGLLVATVVLENEDVSAVKPSVGVVSGEGRVTSEGTR